MKIRIIDGMDNATTGDLKGLESDILTDGGGVADKAGGDFAVTQRGAGANMSVDVAAGIAYVPSAAYDRTDTDTQKYWEAVEDAATTNKVIGANSSGSARVDLVCVKIDPTIDPGDNGELAGSIVVVAGTPGAGVPSTPDNHYVLAQIAVANGASSIVTGNITDERAQITLLGDLFALPSVKRAFYVPAAAMFPSTTAGCATVAQVESSSNKVNIKVLDFDGAGSSKEYAEFGIQAPSYWDLGTVTVEFIWIPTAGSGTVNWEIQGLARSDGDAIDTAYGTLQEVTDTVLTTGQVHESPVTSALTIGGTPAKDDWLQFRVARDPANDTDTSDARLLGVRIRFGVDEYDDQ